MVQILGSLNTGSVISGENEILQTVFLRILDMGITASFLIAAVLGVRLVFRNMPVKFRFILWILAGIRLIFPYSVESAFSLVPVRTHLDTAVIHQGNLRMEEGIAVINGPVSQHVPQHELLAENSVNPPLALVIDICSKIWALGVIAMAVAMIYSWLRLRWRLATAVPQEVQLPAGFLAGKRKPVSETDVQGCSCVKIYRCAQTGSPFLFGLIHPKIYVPYTVSDKDIPYVVMHECVHRQRRDYLVKPAGYLLLSCYWFHPLVWIAFIWMCRDMEAACDEAVIHKLGMQCKKEYSRALLSCSIKKQRITACPLSFGEPDVKKRVKNVLAYKKPAALAIVSAAAVCMIIILCFMTQKEQSGQHMDKNQAIETIGSGKETEKISESKGQEIAAEMLAGEAASQSASYENGEVSKGEDIITEQPVGEADMHAVFIDDYFPNPHEEQSDLVMEADLDKDGNPEKIVMTSLGYNGGDGGYKLEVFRIKDGTEEKISLPDNYIEETGFPFEMEWTGREAVLTMPKGETILFTEQQILENSRRNDTEQFLKKQMDAGGLDLTYPSDAVSGFTVAEDAKDHKTVLIVKQYLMGYGGHADCFGYAVACLKLRPDNQWETDYLYMQKQ